MGGGCGFCSFSLSFHVFSTFKKQFFFQISNKVAKKKMILNNIWVVGPPTWHPRIYYLHGFLFISKWKKGLLAGSWFARDKNMSALFWNYCFFWPPVWRESNKSPRPKLPTHLGSPGNSSKSSRCKRKRIPGRELCGFSVGVKKSVSIQTLVPKKLLYNIWGKTVPLNHPWLDNMGL